MSSHCFTRALKPSKTFWAYFFPDVPFFLFFVFSPCQLLRNDFKFHNYQEAPFNRATAFWESFLASIYSSGVFNLMILIVMLPDKLIYYYRKIDKILAKFFQSFISPRIIATAQIGVLFLKAFYLSFQMDIS